MKKITKSNSIFALAILTIGIVSTITSCTMDEHNSAGGDSYTREQVMASIKDIVDISSVNLDTFEITTVDREETESYINLCLDIFSTKAYIARRVNELSPDSVDIYLIPFVSHYASSIEARFNATQNGAKIKTFRDTDKDKVNAWANEQADNGYIIVYYYDEKTKEYCAIAYTELEWAMLHMKP